MKVQVQCHRIDSYQRTHSDAHHVLFLGGFPESFTQVLPVTSTVVVLVTSTRHRLVSWVDSITDASLDCMNQTWIESEQFRTNLVLLWYSAVRAKLELKCKMHKIRHFFLTPHKYCSTPKKDSGCRMLSGGVHETKPIVTLVSAALNFRCVWLWPKHCSTDKTIRFTDFYLPMVPSSSVGSVLG